ncbi:MAG TPA: hypothetical protein VK420_21275, partial [Longimicrobium sp.]|nr:hypothetical protein [Longimicrobium sp.]
MGDVRPNEKNGESYQTLVTARNFLVHRAHAMEGSVDVDQYVIKTSGIEVAELTQLLEKMREQFPTHIREDSLATVPDEPLDQKSSLSTAKPKFHRAPGGRLLGVADFLCSARTMDQVFLPIINDMRVEYADALLEGHTWKARWIHMRGVWAFLSSAGIYGAVRVVRRA